MNSGTLREMGFGYFNMLPTAVSFAKGVYLLEDGAYATNSYPRVHQDISNPHPVDSLLIHSVACK